jgi:hypothetical protein
MPVLLVMLLSIAVSIAAGIIVLLVRRVRAKPPANTGEKGPSGPRPCERTSVFPRPNCWLAVKSRSMVAVQSALGLHNPKPCSWIEGLADDERLFIAPPVKGWILVLGSGLPDPSDDVDACFRFVLDMSRKLGRVQFFAASRVLHYHAWVQADGGRILRAYAWAGRTLWTQGAPTRAEKELDLKCFDYGEPAERISFTQPDVVASNADKVPLLAARWSLDPARIDERFLANERGIAGELARRF